MKVEQPVYGLKGGTQDFCAEDSVGDYHGKDVESTKKDKDEQELING